MLVFRCPDLARVRRKSSSFETTKGFCFVKQPSSVALEKTDCNLKISGSLIGYPVEKNESVITWFLKEQSVIEVVARNHVKCRA